jgi:hypothetical protein
MMDWSFAAMTRPKKDDVPLIGEIDPGKFYRMTQSQALFNLGWQATKNKIRDGKLPRPSPLDEDSKITGWLGSQILEHRARMQALAAEKAAADAVRPKQDQPPARKRKTKKVKLRRSSKRSKTEA